MQIERELKFRITDADAARVWRVLPAGRRRRRRTLRSLYFDTPDFRLLAARAALRLRWDGRRWLQTLKFERPGEVALAGRMEWETVVARRAVLPGHLPAAELEARVGLPLAALVERLAPVFETRFERRSSELCLPDGTRIEASLDRGTIRAGRRRERLLELELELLEGDPVALIECAGQAIEPLGLRLEFRSKAQRGYRLAQGAREAPLKAASFAFGPQAGVERAFLEVFGASLGQAGANLRGIASSTDPEYLHQTRVGLRRLRTALRAFRGLLPKTLGEPLVAELRAVTPALGPARDLDVLAETLAGIAPSADALGPSLAPLLRRVQLRRARARRAARACASSAAFQHFILHGLIWTERRPWRSLGAAQPAAERKVGPFAARALAKLERRVTRTAKRIDWSDADARHALRVRLKRLRYGCEFFASCYVRKGVRRYLERLETLQDLLGELNDLAVARRLLASLGAGACAPASGFVQGWMAAREQLLSASLAAAWRALQKTKRFW